jgi:hypothetical protein
VAALLHFLQLWTQWKHSLGFLLGLWVGFGGCWYDEAQTNVKLCMYKCKLQ